MSWVRSVTYLSGTDKRVRGGECVRHTRNKNSHLARTTSQSPRGSPIRHSEDIDIASEDRIADETRYARLSRRCPISQDLVGQPERQLDRKRRASGPVEGWRMM